MYRPDEYWRLYLGWTKDESLIWISTLRTTAEHFGWATAKRYEFVPRPSQGYPGWPRYITDPGPRRWRIGGTRIRISRSPSRNGHPAGLTHSLRISEHVTMFDLAELAYLAQGDWYWLEARNGERITRERWLSYYAAPAA